MSRVAILLCFILLTACNTNTSTKPLQVAEPATPLAAVSDQIIPAEQTDPPVQVNIPSQNEPLPEEPDVVLVPEPEPELTEEQDFDPSLITQEEYNSVKNEIQALIQSLNTIVRAKDYKTWVTYLTASYFATISSPGYLEERSNDLYKKIVNEAAKNGRDISRIKKISLKNPQDYFLHVVVPSHANDRVEDIEFVSETRVKAYTLDDRDNWLVLYNLEHKNGRWMIMN